MDAQDRGHKTVMIPSNQLLTQHFAALGVLLKGL